MFCFYKHVPLFTSHQPIRKKHLNTINLFLASGLCRQEFRTYIHASSIIYLALYLFSSPWVSSYSFIFTGPPVSLFFIHYCVWFPAGNLKPRILKLLQDRQKAADAYRQLAGMLLTPEYFLKLFVLLLPCYV